MSQCAPLSFKHILRRWWLGYQWCLFNTELQQSMDNGHLTVQQDGAGDFQSWPVFTAVLEKWEHISGRSYADVQNYFRLTPFSSVGLLLTGDTLTKLAMKKGLFAPRNSQNVTSEPGERLRGNVLLLMHQHLSLLNEGAEIGKFMSIG